MFVAVASFTPGPTFAEQTPSTVMRDLPQLSPTPPGYVRLWTLKLEYESTSQSEIDLCRKFLLEKGFQPLLSATTRPSLALPVLKIFGTKEYSVAGTQADDIWIEMKKLMVGLSGTFTWGVSEKYKQQVQRRP